MLCVQVPAFWELNLNFLPAVRLDLPRCGCVFLAWLRSDDGVLVSELIHELLHELLLVRYLHHGVNRRPPGLSPDGAFGSLLDA